MTCKSRPRRRLQADPNARTHHSHLRKTIHLLEDIFSFYMDLDTLHHMYVEFSNTQGEKRGKQWPALRLREALVGARRPMPKDDMLFLQDLIERGEITVDACVILWQVAFRACLAWLS